MTVQTAKNYKVTAKKTVTLLVDDICFFIQQGGKGKLFKLLCWWIPGSDELADEDATTKNQELSTKSKPHYYYYKRT